MNIHQRRRAERAAIMAAEAKAREEAAAPIAVEAHTKASLGKMGKDELENLGRSQFNIELDKRKTKAALIKEILKAQN